MRTPRDRSLERGAGAVFRHAAVWRLGEGGGRDHQGGIMRISPMITMAPASQYKNFLFLNCASLDETIQHGLVVAYRSLRYAMASDHSRYARPAAAIS